MRGYRSTLEDAIARKEVTIGRPLSPESIEIINTAFRGVMPAEADLNSRVVPGELFLPSPHMRRLLKGSHLLKPQSVPAFSRLVVRHAIQNGELDAQTAAEEVAVQVISSGIHQGDASKRLLVVNVLDRPTKVYEEGYMFSGEANVLQHLLKMSDISWRPPTITEEGVPIREVPVGMIEGYIEKVEDEHFGELTDSIIMAGGLAVSGVDIVTTI